jgi:lipid-A-disaccharide synthase
LTTSSTGKTFVSAGDISGDRHAAGVIARCRAAQPKREWSGFGGESMRAAGCRLLIDPEPDPVIGFTRVLAKIPHYFRLLARIHRHFLVERPDIVVLCDYPGLNLQIARLARMLNIPVLYFICPQFWAWAPWRIGRFARLVDRALVIFPFEERYFSSHGIDATWIGHPVFDHTSFGDGTRLPPREGDRDFLPQGQILALLPGSRKQEVRTNLPVMLRLADALAKDHPGVVPVVTHDRPECLRIAQEIAEAAGVAIHAVEGSIVESARAARLCLVASGTATLEVALTGSPLVVIYRVSPLARRLSGLLLTIPWFCQVNLMAGEELVPEFLLGDDDPAPFLPVSKALFEEGITRETMIARLAAFRTKHHSPGSLDRAAEEVLSFAKRTHRQGN